MLKLSAACLAGGCMFLPVIGLFLLSAGSAAAQTKSPTWATVLRLAQQTRFNNPRTLGVVSAPPAITPAPTAPAGQTTVYNYWTNGTTVNPVFRGFGGWQQTYASYVRFPCVTRAATGNGNISANPQVNAVSWHVEFMANASKVTLMIFNQTVTPYRFLVNGQYVSMTPTVTPLNDGSIGYITLDFTGAGGLQTRKIAVEGMQNSGFAGVRVGSGETISPTSSTDLLRMIVLGDSITAATGATCSGDNWGSVMADCLGIRDYWPSGSGGTGYLATNVQGTICYTLRQRLSSDALTRSPDLVGFAMGINDTGTFTPAQTQTEVVAAITALRAVLPTTPLIVFGSFAGSSGPSSAIYTNEGAIQAAVQQYVLANNDPNTIFIPVSSKPVGSWTDGPWIWGTGNTSNPKGNGNSDIYTSSDGTHPNAAGHWQLGLRAADAIIAALSGNYTNLHPDGVPAALKYLYDIDPIISMSPTDRAGLPATNLLTNGVDHYLTLTYRKRASATNVNVIFQSRSNLQNAAWQTVTPAAVVSGLVGTMNGDPLMRAGFKITGSPAGFYRIGIGF